MTPKILKEYLKAYLDELALQGYLDMVHWTNPLYDALPNVESRVIVFPGVEHEDKVPGVYMEMTFGSDDQAIWCHNTGVWVHREQCDCDECHDYRTHLAEQQERDRIETLQSFPAAAPDPAICQDDYYGLPCNNPNCPKADKHRWTR